MQVIIGAQDRPFSRLVKTVAAVRDMEIPEGCSKSVHIIFDARSAACQPGILLMFPSTSSTGSIITIMLWV